MIGGSNPVLDARSTFGPERKGWAGELELQARVPGAAVAASWRAVVGDFDPVAGNAGPGAVLGRAEEQDFITVRR